jgi:hypothetical protein
LLAQGDPSEHVAAVTGYGTPPRPLSCARHLLNCGRAAVDCRFPFTIIPKEGELTQELEPLRLKIAPGSTTTGLAAVNDATGLVVWAAGSCNVKTGRRTIEGIHVHYCQPLQRGDGYAYAPGAALSPQA